MVLETTKSKMKSVLKITSIVLFSIVIVYLIVTRINLNYKYEVGQAIDSLNGVMVYYNGAVGTVTERNLKDGYNIGLKYQCVEFVKRYYYEYLNHKMPDTYGHAKHFFDKNLKDGDYNKKRDLYQFSNPSKSKPQVSDLIIFSPTITNRFGHVAIISKVDSNSIEIIQQNPGPFNSSRESFPLKFNGSEWNIQKDRILGVLRKHMR